MIEPVNQAAVLASGQALVPDYAQQLMRERLMGVQQRQADTQAQQEARLLAGAQREIARQQQFSTVMEHVLSRPTKDGIEHVVGQFPEFHEPAKRVWDAMDRRERQMNLSQWAQIFSSGANGRWDLAERVLQARVDADKAAGDHDQADDEMLAMIRSEDPEQRRRALGMIGYQIASVDGLEKFASTLDKVLPVTDGEPFEKYARSLGLKPGTEEYNRALQDYVLRGQGPTATAYDLQVEDARQGNRLELESSQQAGRVGLEGVRQGNRVALEGVKETNERSRPPKAERVNVLERIREKIASGQPLTPGEQRVYNDAQAKGRAAGGGKGRGNAGSAIIVNPQTGQRLQLHGGKWVPVK